MCKSFSVLFILSVLTLSSALRNKDQSSLDVENLINTGCTAMCHWKTSGPCQHPDDNNEVCMEMIHVNGTDTCPAGLYECGPRPVRSEPSPPPSKSASTTSSITSSISPPPSKSASTTSSITSSISPSSSSYANLLRNDNLVAEGLTVKQDNYRISFDITAFGTNNDGAFTNIFHYTKGGNCCNFGQRVPALWFYPGSTQFYWVAGNPSSPDEWVRNDFKMNLNQEYHVDLKVVNGTAYQFIDGNLTNENGVGQQLKSVGPTQTDVKLYLSNPYHNAANAEVKNFGYFLDAT